MIGRRSLVIEVKSRGNSHHFIYEVLTAFHLSTAIMEPFKCSQKKLIMAWLSQSVYDNSAYLHQLFIVSKRVFVSVVYCERSREVKEAGSPRSQPVTVVSSDLKIESCNPAVYVEGFFPSKT